MVWPSGYPAFSIHTKRGENPDVDSTTQTKTYGQTEVGTEIAPLKGQYPPDWKSDNLILNEVILNSSYTVEDIFVYMAVDMPVNYAVSYGVIYEKWTGNLVEISNVLFLTPSGPSWNRYHFASPIDYLSNGNYYFGIYIEPDTTTDPTGENWWTIDFYFNNGNIFGEEGSYFRQYNDGLPSHGHTYLPDPYNNPYTTDPLDNIDEYYDAFTYSMYLSGYNTVDNNYIGNHTSDEIGYDGALGHQYIFDIDSSNNAISGRSNFEYGLIYSGRTYDDYSGYRTNTIDNDTPYSLEEDNEATTLGKLNYEPYGATLPIFTHLPWTGLKSHLILGKHEYDTFAVYDDDVFQAQRVASIDGYSTALHDDRYSRDPLNNNYYFDSIADGNVSHARGVVPSDSTDQWTQTNPNQAEKATDPMDMGLWSRPYLLDDDGGIEVGPSNYKDSYMMMDDLSNDDEYYWYHNERYNVGSGTVQAGTNGKGLISLMPMFDWDGVGGLSLTGVSNGYQSANYGGSDIRGLLTDRGTGGIANCPSTRDQVRNSIALGNAAMMVGMAIDNSLVNIVRDNNTTGTNFLNPQFDNGENIEKYPYRQGVAEYEGDHTKAIRVADIYGPGILDISNPESIETDDYGSYPFYTGNYGKYVWANLDKSDDSDGEQSFTNGTYVPLSIDTTPIPDSFTSNIGDMVGIMDNYTTSVGLEVGDSAYPNQYLNQAAYMGLVNLSFDGDYTNRKLTTSVTTGTNFGQSTNQYTSYVDDSINYKFNSGWNPNGNTMRGSSITSNTLGWEIYPKSTFDDTISENNYMMAQMNNKSGGVFVDIEPDLQTEMMVYNPLVGIQNQQNVYEFNFEAADPFRYTRGIYPDVFNIGSNIGGSLPWSVESPVILTSDMSLDMHLNNYTHVDTSNNGYNNEVIEASQIYEDGEDVLEGQMSTFMAFGYMCETVFDIAADAVDGKTNSDDPEYGGWASGDATTTDPTAYSNQWLANVPDDDHGKVVLVLNLDQISRNKDLYPTKTIQISPAMNSNLIHDSGYSGTQVFVNCAKEVLYEAYDAEIGGNIVDRRVLNFQEWQVSDYVVHYEESKPIARIELTILSVYDENYSLDSGEEHGATTCEDNYGGFAEIYWHLDPIWDPSPVEVEYTNVYGEDNIRYQSKDKSTMIDSGEYFTTNNIDRVGLLGVNSSFYVGVSKNDKGTNERYQIGNSCTIQASNANLSNELTRQLRDEMAKESQEMINTQVAITFWSIVLVASLLAVVITGFKSLIGAGISWGALGTALGAGVKAGAIAGVKMGLVYAAFVGGLSWLSTVCPTGAAYMSMAFDSVDALVSFVTMTVCWWLDVPIHAFNPSFDSIILVGPLVFGMYSSTLDLVGTLPRWITVNEMNKLYPNQGDFRHVIFENYELAMMNGQYYDFFGKYSSDLGCGPAWFT